MDKDREAFEAWCIANRYSIDKDRHSGAYLFPANGRWDTWKGARDYYANEYSENKK